MYLARRKSNLSVPVSGESGMMIVQVVIVSAVLLGVLLAGFKTVQTTIKAANTTATSAAFKDLVLAVQQNLSSTNECGKRLGLTGVIPIAAMTAASTTPAGYPVTVKRPNLQPPHLAVKETSSTPPASVSFEFKITEVSLRNVRRVGWPTGGLPSLGGGAAGTQELGKWAADLTVVANRRSGFLGGATMTGQVPLILGVVGNFVRTCTTRSLYQVELGPPGTISTQRKSGLECVDRGGVPIIDPDAPENAPWYVCRLPISTFLACDLDKKKSNLPGWNCHRSTVTDLVTKTGFTDVF